MLPGIPLALDLLLYSVFINPPQSENSLGKSPAIQPAL